MGYGDELIASGMARGAQALRRKRMAFGDGKRIIFSQWSEAIFRNNPNVARPGDERATDLEWCDHYLGHRRYMVPKPDRLLFNYNFRSPLGELFFDGSEIDQGPAPGFILIEPNVSPSKPISLNKQWPVERFQAVATQLMLFDGHRVVQLVYPGGRYLLKGVEQWPCASFRDACVILAQAALVITHEGGMHHAAAALGVPAIVIFGGCIPPQVLGYPMHVNLTGGVDEACGSLKPCAHCRDALNAITTDEVYAHAHRLGRNGNVAGL
jgi:Glycosyltransferase family 9 (heptosyltransferase)